MIETAGKFAQKGTIGMPGWVICLAGAANYFDAWIVDGVSLFGRLAGFERGFIGRGEAAPGNIVKGVKFFLLVLGNLVLYTVVRRNGRTIMWL